jgi:hypothetical protein
MKVELLRIFGTLVAALALFLFLTATQQSFVPFEYAKYPINETLTPVNQEIGHAVSYTLWSERQLDMIILALLLFVSATCCATVLRTEESDQK